MKKRTDGMDLQIIFFDWVAMKPWRLGCYFELRKSVLLLVSFKSVQTLCEPKLFDRTVHSIKTCRAERRPERRTNGQRPGLRTIFERKHLCVSKLKRH